MLKITEMLEKVVSQDQVLKKYGKYLPRLSSTVSVSQPISGCGRECFRLSDLTEQVRSIQSQKEQLDRLLNFYNQILEAEMKSGESLPSWVLKIDGNNSYQGSICLGNHTGGGVLHGYTNVVLIKRKKEVEWLFRKDITVDSPEWALEAERRMSEAHLLPWYEETTAIVSDFSKTLYDTPGGDLFDEEKTAYLGAFDHEGESYDLYYYFNSWSDYFIRVGKDGYETLREDVYSDHIRKSFGLEFREEIQKRKRKVLLLKDWA